MDFFSLKNLASSQAVRGLAPWDYPVKPMPDFSSKKEFRAWCMSPQTEHYFFSLYEGANAALRIAEKENPAVLMHGLVADYDSSLLEGAWEGVLKRCSPDYPPARGSLTPSGHARVVWEFEAPVWVYNNDAHKAFLNRLAAELRVDKLLPSLDKDAFFKTNLTYECGHDWRVLGTKPVATVTLHHWMFKAGEKARWAEKGEVVVPLERVREKMEDKYPGRWQGEFEYGSTGIRFWDLIADNPTAAIVRETGMQTFTGGKPFVSWREIFGHRFVEEYEEDRIATAVEDVFFDGKHYWRKLGDHWKLHLKEDLSLHMRVACSLRGKPDGRESCSEVDRAVYHVQEFNRIEAALPLVHQRRGITHRHGERLLNVSTCRVVQPVETAQVWGENFPFISQWLTNGVPPHLATTGFFDPTPIQMDRFLAWLQRFYASAYVMDVLKGQSAFFAGPVNQGKTLLTNAFIGEMMGGVFDASETLLGKTSFNSSAYASPVWAVDDSNPGNDPKVHASFSANVKKVTANQNFEFLAKFRDSMRINWRCRVTVTLNDDAESMRMLIDADISALDKVMFFKIANRVFHFPPKPDAVIAAELPFFCRWLLDWKMPDHCQGENRYGVREYHEPSMLDAARRLGRTSEFRELLTSFRAGYFETVTDDFWEGTATQLMSTLALDPGLAAVMRNHSAASMGRELRKLQSLGFSIEDRVLQGNKVWKIGKHDKFKESKA